MATTDPDVPTTMRAALLLGRGGPEMLEVRDNVPVPRPTEGEVLIKVAACGMNNTDRSLAGYFGSERDGGFAEYCGVAVM